MIATFLATKISKHNLMSLHTGTREYAVKRWSMRLAFALVVGSVGFSALGQTPATRRGTQGEAASTPTADESIPVPSETSSVTKHDWAAGGTTIHYTATAGNLIIKDDKDHPNGSLFYVAYTQDG